MKTIKKIIFAILSLAIVTPAFADNQLIDGIIGAVAGGAGGRALCRHCNNRNKNIATGVAALGGAWVGSTVGDDSERRFQQRQQQRAQIAQANLDQYSGGNQSGYQTSGYQSRQVAPIDVSSQSRQTEWVEVREPAPVAIVRTAAPARRVVVDNGVAVSGDCSREQYYHGQYDPEAAQAFCQGQQEARALHAKRVQQAYQEGLVSN